MLMTVVNYKMVIAARFRSAKEMSVFPADLLTAYTSPYSTYIAEGYHV